MSAVWTVDICPVQENERLQLHIGLHLENTQNRNKKQETTLFTDSMEGGQLK